VQHRGEEARHGRRIGPVDAAPEDGPPEEQRRAEEGGVLQRVQSRVGERRLE
jgi:hypothetical protein